MLKAGRGGRAASAGDAGGAARDGATAFDASGMDPLDCAWRWREAGQGVALATVVETWGSSPVPAGGLLAVNAAGHFEGSVSGGCVEGAVIERAHAVIESGRPETLEFGIADEMAWSVGLACGGRVRIFVERLEPLDGLQGGER